MSESFEFSLDKHGRILITPGLRDRLGLSEGMTLVVEEGEDGILLRVETASPTVVDKGGVLVIRTQPLEDLTEVVRQERNRRTDVLLQRTGL